MTPGNRVLITKSDNSFLLGCVVKVIGTQSIVSLDNRPFQPETFVQIPNQLLLPVNYWLLQNSRTKYENIKFDPNEDPHKLFLSAKNSKFDLAAVRAMWCWTNDKLFNYELHIYPVLRDRIIGFKNPNKGAKTYGLFHGKTPPELSVAIKAMISLKQCFAVTVHEMVHQYQYEKQEEPGHGPAFRKWIEPVKSVCNVKLDTFSLVSDDERDADFKKEDLNNEEIKSKNYYVLMIHKDGQFWAIGCNDLNLLERIRDVYVVKYQVYLRKMNNPKLRTVLKFQTSFSKNVKNWTLMPPKLSNTIIEDGLSVYSSILRCC